MTEIRDILERLFNIEISAMSDKWMYGHSDAVVVAVYSPLDICNSSKNTDKWVVRIAPYETFRKWDESRAIIKYFDTCEDVIEYLTTSSNDILKELLKLVSLDFIDFRKNVAGYLSEPSKDKLGSIYTYMRLTDFE